MTTRRGEQWDDSGGDVRSWVHAPYASALKGEAQTDLFDRIRRRRLELERAIGVFADCVPLLREDRER